MKDWVSAIAGRIDMTDLEKKILALIEQQIEMIHNASFISMTSEEMSEYEARRCMIASLVDRLNRF